MALRDKRRLPGDMLVNTNARTLMAYRYVERECMRLLGGWMAITPEWDVKLATGKHLWEGAQHVERLNRRLVELRHPHGFKAPVALRELMAQVDQADDTLHRLVGVYRVAKRYLATAYAEHAQRTSAVADAPTVDLLLAMLPTLERHIAWGESWIAELANTAEKRESAVRWQAALEARLPAIRTAVAGVARVETFETDPPPPEPRWDESKPYTPQVQNAVRDERFVPLHNVRPDASDFTPEQELLSRLHRMTSSELGAAELLGRVLYEHTQMPWAFHYDMARQTWDEVRHCELAWKRLEDLGGYLGMFPEKHGGNFERRNSMDLPRMLAILGPIEEAHGNISFKQFVKESLAKGDFETALLYDYVLADETTHVRFTTRWIAWLANHDTAKQKRWIEEAKALSAAWNEERKRTTQHLDLEILRSVGYTIDAQGMAEKAAAMEVRPLAD